MPSSSPGVTVGVAVPGGWKILNPVRNPWGQVALTDGGKSLHGRARAYLDKLLSQHDAKDPDSRRHHDVPRTYLRQWSFDGKRIWALDTVTGVARPLGLANVCVEENFYRVVGRDGAAHNRVELLFGVVDTELRRIQALFNELEDPDELEFDDLMALGVTMAVQRMRTLQQRRLQRQHSAWLVAQNPRDFLSIDDPENPYSAAGIHTELLFKNMWDAADVLTIRQIEVWHHPILQRPGTGSSGSSTKGSRPRPAAPIRSTHGPDRRGGDQRGDLAPSHDDHPTEGRRSTWVRRERS